jgi:hypothetical protein
MDVGFFCFREMSWACHAMGTLKKKTRNEACKRFTFFSRVYKLFFRLWRCGLSCNAHWRRKIEMSLERFAFFCRVANCFLVSGDAPCHAMHVEEDKN